MYKIIFSGLLLCSFAASAQDKKKATLDSVDNVIINEIITPAEKEAGDEGPDWTGITKQVKAKYSDVQTDRAVTKAKIYFYYSKDWPLFSTAIVHYTNAYEDKEDFKLMNKNAKFILQYSSEMDEWKSALGWVKHAADKEPSNEDYKKTVTDLNYKINGK